LTPFIEGYWIFRLPLYPGYRVQVPCHRNNVAPIQNLLARLVQNSIPVTARNAFVQHKVLTVGCLAKPGQFNWDWVLGHESCAMTLIE
jgi:hypothetical protein